MKTNQILLHEEIGTGYKTYATISAIDSPIGSYQLELSTTFAKASDPSQHRTTFKYFFASGEELTRMGDLLKSV